MRLDPFSPEKSGDRIVDRIQSAIAEGIRRLNLSFATSDRIARRITAPSLPVNWAALGVAVAEYPILACPYELEVKAIAWLGQSAIAVNGVNYRQFQLLRRRNALPAGTVAQRDTSTNGNAIAAFVPWTLRLSTDANVLRCKIGDVLSIAIPAFGANAPIVPPGGFTLDYEIIREAQS